MKRASILLVSAVLLVAACSSDSKTSSSASSSSSTSTSSSSSSSPSSSTATSSSSAAASGASTLSTAQNAKVGKAILVDSKGMTVYLYDPDGTSATSKVPDGIKANWPPVTATSATAGTGLDASKIALQQQADGTMQVAYNGHLLYLFVGDKAAGDANGQGLGGVWYVLTADGAKVDTD